MAIKDAEQMISFGKWFETYWRRQGRPAVEPDLDRGEVACGSCGLFKTRERAMLAAAASNTFPPDDVIITQTCRGDWVWRTRALDAIWRENAVRNLRVKRPCPPGIRRYLDERKRRENAR